MRVLGLALRSVATVTDNQAKVRMLTTIFLLLQGVAQILKSPAGLILVFISVCGRMQGLNEVKFDRDKEWP